MGWRVVLAVCFRVLGLGLLGLGLFGLGGGLMKWSSSEAEDAFGRSEPACGGKVEPSEISLDLRPGPEEVRLFIVEGRDLDTVITAVRDVGGEVTHELGIINAVAALLTNLQQAELEESEGVARLQDDHVLRTASTSASTAVRDEFRGKNYSGNDGTAGWSSDWIDSDPDDGSAVGGTIYVTKAPECPSAGGGSKCLAVEPSKGYSLTREVNLAAATSATLSYAYAHEALDGETTLVLEVSDDGGQTWGVLKIFAEDVAANGTEVFNLTPYLSFNTQIRFRDVGDNGKKIYFDNLQIEYAVALDTVYSGWIGGDQLHAQGIDGTGVTVAVVDTGYWAFPGLDNNSNGQARVLAQYDAIEDQLAPAVTSNDGSGHGTHVTSIILSSVATDDGKYNGVAPAADLVSVKAFAADGSGSYADVIRAIDWVVSNQGAYGIQVLNLSFNAEPLSFYWDDPLNKAVMAAWQAGVVVVTSAGNRGPDPMSIGVPGNIPYVITVGAMSDNQTPADDTDDTLTSFSGAGPTLEGFIKPEMVAPGSRMMGLIAPSSEIANSFPQWQNGDYFTISGTSQAAAVVSGVVALMLQDNPSLTPDQVKCRLMDAAHAAVDAAGNLAYSPFQQGVGVVDAYGAIYSTAAACANAGLDIAKDLDGSEHYAGPVRWDDSSDSFFVEGVGYGWDASYPAGDVAWTGSSPWINSSPWVDGSPWINSSPWVDGSPWINSSPWVDGSPWINSSPWVDGVPWDVTDGGEHHLWSSSLSETMAINLWVDQE